MDSRPISYGSVISLRHSNTEKYLYSDHRTYVHVTGSGQQIVAASSTADTSTLWLVKPPSGISDNLLFGLAVKNHDQVRLEHVKTRRNLHSHSDRTASSDTNQQEVTCYGQLGAGDHNDNWTLEIENGGVWYEDLKIRLVHSDTSAALHSHERIITIPDAGQLQEVTGFRDRDTNDYWIATISTTVQSAAPRLVTSSKVSNLLQGLNIAGSIASVTGLTLITLGKSFSEIKLADILVYILATSAFIGVLLYAWLFLMAIHRRLLARGNAVVVGYWFLAAPATFVAACFAWLYVVDMATYTVRPIITRVLSGH